MRACIVQGSQQIWVAALWYWGYSLNGREDGYIPPWWICLIVWPLACVSFLFAYVMLYGLPEYYRQTPPKVPHFFKTLFRRKLVLWFLASEILRDYWLSGVSMLLTFSLKYANGASSRMDATGASCGVCQYPNGRFCSSSSHSSFSFGRSCFSFSHTSAKPTLGYCPSSRSVLARPDGVKCFGVPHLSRCTSRGQAPEDLTSASRYGCGWECWMLFKVLVWV